MLANCTPFSKRVELIHFNSQTIKVRPVNAKNPEASAQTLKAMTTEQCTRMEEIVHVTLRNIINNLDISQSMFITHY